MNTLNQPYRKILTTNTEGKQEVTNEITKERPYLSLTAIPRKDEKGEPMEPFIMPNRKQRRTSHKYIQLVDGSRLKAHGNNRKPFQKRKNGKKVTGRTSRF